MSKLKSSVLDEARLEFVTQHPEMIVRMGGWEIAHYCTVCETPIKANHPSITTREPFEFSGSKPHVNKCWREWVEQLQCPHCKTPNKYHCPSTDYLGASTYQIKFTDIEPLPHKIYKQRKIYTSEEKVERTGWFSHKVTPAQYFVERIFMKEVK